MIKTFCILSTFMAALLSGCASQIDPAIAERHQALIQNMQSRVFETGDGVRVSRGVILALQDMNFIIKKASTALGIAAAKPGAYPITLGVTIKVLSDSRVRMHISAQYDHKIIEDPTLYEKLFSTIGKTLNLVASSG
jgi:hypothetical protein